MIDNDLLRDVKYEISQEFMQFFPDSGEAALAVLKDVEVHGYRKIPTEPTEEMMEAIVESLYPVGYRPDRPYLDRADAQIVNATLAYLRGELTV